MKKYLGIFQVGIGLLALTVLALVLNSLLQARGTETIGRTPAGVAVNATAKPTREEQATREPTGKPKVDWANAMLDQITLRTGHPILAHNGRIRIWSWLPDKRRLLLELEDRDTQDVTMQFQIVTLDTKTGKVVEYGHRPESDEPPLWVEQTKSIVFRYWDVLHGKAPELRIGHPGGQVDVIVVPDLVSLNEQPTTGTLYYLVNDPTEKSLRTLEPNQPESSASRLFPALSFPASKSQIDASGRFLAAFTPQSLAVLNLATGEAHQYQTLEPSESEAMKQILGVWSPAGEKFGLVSVRFGSSGGLWTKSTLSLFHLDDGKIQPIELPTQFILEFDWSPTGKFIIVRGTPTFTAMNHSEIFWLVDSENGEYKRLPDFLKATTSDPTLMAWSNNGRLAWIQQDKIMIGKFAPER